MNFIQNSFEYRFSNLTLFLSVDTSTLIDIHYHLEEKFLKFLDELFLINYLPNLRYFKSITFILTFWDHLKNNWFTDTHLQQTQVSEISYQSKFVVDNIYKSGFSDCYINILEKFEAQAYIIVPIFKANQLWGLLSVYQNSASRDWKQNEINLVAQISNQLGIALHQAKLFNQIQQQSIEL